MKYIRIYLYTLLTILLFSCEPEIEGVTPVSGDADFSVFVSLGNSLTAGFADNELYKSGQMVSYPNIMARQMMHTGLTEFKAPLMKDELGFGGRLKLGYSTDCMGVESLGLVMSAESPDPMNFRAIYDEEGPFHNLGVPGARVSHLLMPGYGLSNVYFGRFASAPNASIIEDATSLSPTFFSLWIGNNDVLGYALSGGTANNITSIEDFRQNYQAILTQLTVSATGGILANIPDITSIPFFNTIPAIGLVLISQDMVGNLNTAYADIPEVNFQVGVNGFVVSDASAPAGVRQLKSGEMMLLTLPQDSLKCAGWGSQIPIPEQYYLSLQQVSEISSAIQAYNEAIVEFSQTFNLAFVDANSLLREALTGMHFDGLSFNTDFVTGGIFSLDGVHLSPRGNALVANHFIDAINKKYNATIPKVSVTQFQGIVFP